MSDYAVPQLETQRLRLRGWQMRDFDAYAEFMNAPEDQKYRRGAVGREAAFVQFCAKAGEWPVYGYGAFIVAERQTDQAIGYAGLWMAPYLEEPELCWSLFPGSRGKGYATEAALAARNWAYRSLDMAPLMSYVHPDNHASCSVAERLGATLEGEGELRGAPRLIYRHQARPKTNPVA